MCEGTYATEAPMLCLYTDPKLGEIASPNHQSDTYSGRALHDAKAGEELDVQSTPDPLGEFTICHRCMTIWPTNK